MKNYINYHIDLSKIPLDIRKTFYINDDLIKNKIKVKDNWEKLIKLEKNSLIKIEPFWEDKNDFEIKDKELKYIIDLEWNELNKYLEKNKSYWILVRKGVYDRILKANEDFKKLWYEIVIKIWYRPLEVQKILFDEIKKYIKNKFSNLSENEQYNIICEFISDPNNYTPPHSTWWAIDICLKNLNWEYLDMWRPLNYPWEESNITFNDINNKQKENRMLLCDIMLKNWFANLESEWWHFSYWDPIWAYFYWEEESLYWAI